MSNVHVKILEHDEKEHKVHVRYFIDDMDEEALSSNEQELRDVEINGVLVPRWFAKRRDDGSPFRCRTDKWVMLPNPEPDEAALHNYLLDYAPLDWIEHLATLRKSPPEAPVAKSLVGRVLSKPIASVRERWARPIISDTANDVRVVPQPRKGRDL